MHNLYYINFFEFAFEILLQELMNHPMGTTVLEIASSLNTTGVVRCLKDIGLDVSSKEPYIKEIDLQIREKLPEKTSLDVKPNEALVFSNAIRCDTFEEELADLIVLFLLLRYRFRSFSQAQKIACQFSESRLYWLCPSSVYSSLSESNLEEFIYTVLDLVKNRHRLISALKYTLNGTRSWLFTEEDGLLYYYGIEYWARSYRESKWRNVVELLIDMGLVRMKKDRYCLSRLGEKWLARIF